MTLTLKRISYSETETFGVLIQEGVPLFLTLEEAWRENKPNVSCIPVGSYKCKRVDSPKFGDTFEVAKVPGRSHILFHQGCTHLDTEGCILLGLTFGKVGSNNGIMQSRLAFSKFLERTAGVDEFGLDVVD